MRIPQPQYGKRPTRPSAPHMAGGTTGPQGTQLGGANQPRTSSGQRKQGVAGGNGKVGHEIYLWIIVIIEATLTGALRRYFRRFHGG